LSEICLIGGSGFVGSEVSRILQKDGKPFFVSDLRRPSEPHEFEYGDVSLLTVADFADREFNTIINLAAEHRDDVKPLERYWQVNVDGARRVCDVARRKGVSRLVFTSSVAIYGFAPPNTGEGGAPNYFNEYGKTKYYAEELYKEWQAEDPANRSLVIVRPTVIFGPGNRGNVYNLLRQIARRRFVMFGSGLNVKSMAYVENVAKFLVQCTSEKPGVYIYNYIDKPDLSMNQLVEVARKTLFDKSGVGLGMPGFLGITIGVGFDLLAWLIRRPLPISRIRVKKFMATTQFSSAVSKTGFEAPYTLAEGLEKTLRYEFLEDNRDKPTYETE
jgi:nucleoside-diphosphate-sugar epimerase